MPAGLGGRMEVRKYVYILVTVAGQTCAGKNRPIGSSLQDFSIYLHKNLRICPRFSDQSCAVVSTAVFIKVWRRQKGSDGFVKAECVIRQFVVVV